MPNPTTTSVRDIVLRALALATVVLALTGGALAWFFFLQRTDQELGTRVQQIEADHQQLQKLQGEIDALRPKGAPVTAEQAAAVKQEHASLAMAADQRVTRLGLPNALLLGASQILALLPGISRDGIVMVSGMFRGLSRQDAARFSFLLSAPVSFAAGVLKIGDLTGPLGKGIHGQVLFGSILSGIGAYFALRFLDRYLSNPTRTLTPFAIYCLAAGAGAFIYLAVK